MCVCARVSGRGEEGGTDWHSCWRRPWPSFCCSVLNRLLPSWHGRGSWPKSFHGSTEARLCPHHHTAAGSLEREGKGGREGIGSE